MTYPVNITRVSLNHRGGTKSYHVYLVETAGGQAVFISRWGKTGQFGDLKVEIGTPKKMASAYDSKLRQKRNGGYEAAAPQRVDAAGDWSGVVSILTPALVAKMGKEAIEAIDPAIDTSSIPSARPARLDEEGRLTGDDAPRGVDPRSFAEAQERAKREAQEKERQAYANDPMYGAF